MSFDRFQWIPETVLKSGKVPFIVLEEWIQTLGTSRITELTIPIFKYIKDNNHLLSSKSDIAYLAQFINPFEPQWKKSVLLRIWNKLKPTLTDRQELNKLVESSEWSSIGLPTMKEPTKLPASLVFAYCHYHQLWLPVNATFDTIIQTVRLYQWTGSEDVTIGMKKAVSTLIQLDPINWVNTWNFLNINKSMPSQPPLIKYDRETVYSVFHSSWASKLFTIENYEPKNELDAILCSAMHYGIDITTSQDKLLEYTNLTMSLKNHATKPRTVLWGKFNYDHPVDSHLARWTAKNPHALSLKKYYNPLFPIEIYPQEIRESHAYLYGKNSSTDTLYMTTEDFFSTLDIHTCKTFYVGFPETFLNTDMTPIQRLDIESLSNDQIIAYGSPQDGWTVFIWEELYDYLSTLREFKNPIQSDEMLSETAITRLKLLSENYYPSIAHIITSIQKEQKEFTKQGQAYMMMYFKLSKDEQDLVQLQWWILVYLCMVMRCEWKEPPPSDITTLNRKYPFTLKEFCVDNQDTVDDLVSQWMTVFWTHASTGHGLEKLPLQNYVDGQFIISKNEEQGFTIEDRLKIIINAKSLYSCLRVSSNWLLSTCCFYMQKLSIELPFQISQMQRIS